MTSQPPSAEPAVSEPQPGAPPPAVILVRPREDGNVGSAARAMANMGLHQLILVEPATELGVLGHAFAKGADHVITGLTRVDSLHEAAAPFQRLVGTTSARDRTGGQEIIRPRDLAPRLRREDPPGTRTALVFGPEVSGLSKDELALCHPLVNVPCDPVQPTLNLAQSVLILAYELYLAKVDADEAVPATAEEGAQPTAESQQVDGLFAQVTDLLRRVRYDRDDTFSAVMRDLRRLAARARLSEREVVLMRGMCRRVEYQLDRLDELRADPADDESPPAKAAAGKRRQPHDWSRPGE